jgi:hypothetical protein
MSGCAWCGTPVDIVGNQVGRGDKCPNPRCEEALHSCKNCRHFDPAVAKGCKEPFAEVPRDREGANFCEHFQIGEGGHSAREDQKKLFDAAESLFKKR